MKAAELRDVDILYFIGSFAIGGAERHLSQVLPALSERGWSVAAVTLSEGGGFASNLGAANIPIITLPRGRVIPVPKIRGAFTLFKQTEALSEILVKNPPKALHCFLPTCCQVGALASLQAGYAPVVMSRRSQSSRPSLFLGDKVIEKWALKRAKLVFAHSRIVRDELLSEGIAPEKLVLNHNGIDISYFDRGHSDRVLTRAKEGWAESERIFICVANLIPYKGHEDLIRAFASLCNISYRWKLALVGDGDHTYTQKLKKLVHTLNIAERVQFLGRRSDIPGLLHASDVGVLPSHQEGFPNAILEYMAARLPVIASRVGGNLDLIEDGKSGLVVPVKVPKALSQAVMLMLSDPSYGIQMGRFGRERVESEFSLSACIDRYELAYRGLLK